MERDLRRLRDGAAQEAERDQGHDRVRERAGRRRVEDGPVVEAPDLRDSEEEAERHDRVAKGVHQERLLRGEDRRGRSWRKPIRR